MNIISASLSPNTDRHDIRKAFLVLCSPWTWKTGASIDRVKQWFQHEYNTKHVHLFQSGRVAFYEILKSLGMKEGDEVLVQAFTCVAVPNSVKWVGATPVFVDIDDSYNMDPDDIVKKITKRTRALVVQHTFGIPADLKRIMEIAKNNNLYVIEDCAHAIGATYKGRKIGSFGDAAFFSFGRDKVISSVWGGAAIMKQLRMKDTTYPMPSAWWIVQQLFHPIAFSFILPLYNSGIGKVLLVMLQRLNFLSKPVAKEELSGGMPQRYLTSYPNALAEILEIQLQKLPAMIRIRQENAMAYKKHISQKKSSVVERDGAIYLRFPLIVDKPLAIQKRARQNGVLLGNWYHNIVDPEGSEFQVIGYTRGSCPKAEYVASHVLNIPTLISKEEALFISRLLW